MYEIIKEFTAAGKNNFWHWFDNNVGVGLEWDEVDKGAWTCVAMDELTGSDVKNIKAYIRGMK
jgi:hypothetical protein